MDIRSRIRIAAILAVATVALCAAVPAFASLAPQSIGLDPFEPDNEFATAWDVGLGVTSQAHTFYPAGDQDFLKIHVNAGDVIKVVGDTVGGSDPRVWLLDSDGILVLTENDNERLMNGTNNAALRWRAAHPGDYYARFMGAPATTGNYTVSLSSWPGSQPATAVFDGADRYAVAAKTARAMGGGAVAKVSHVIVASGMDRAAADSLVASGLSGVYGYAPILLTRGSTLPTATASALASISASARLAGRTVTIHIVGGPASVPESLKVPILKAAPRAAFDRIGGADRFAVAVGVAARMRIIMGGSTPRSCLVVNGWDAAYFSDALACGPIAAHAHLPILLVTRTSVPFSTRGALAQYWTARIPVATSGALAPATITAVSTHGTRPITGPNRFATARILAETAEQNDWLRTNTVAVANRLPDALTAGPYAGKKNGPLLFTDASGLAADTRDFVQVRACGPNPWTLGSMTSAAVFGGPASVPLSVRGRVYRLAGALP